MTDVSRESIDNALAQVVDPHLEQDLLASRSVDEVRIDGGTVEVDLKLGYPARGWHGELVRLVEQRLREVPGVNAVKTRVHTRIASHEVQKGVQALPGVKNIIAVASGKGGVGKSTVSANLALALSVEGASVGVLDADIYGPSQPRMLGMSRKPDSRDGKRIEPIVAHGLQIMSIGFLIDEETPMVWRGPMVTQALQQLLGDTNWRDLDYLVIDLPPGTGDIQLTLAQRVPVTGAVIVTTPQDIALLDARKAYRMFEKVDIPVLGVVENMSTHICSQCGHEEHIFGEGGGRRMAEQYQLRHLGALPLDLRIREETDGGTPTVVADPECAVSLIFRDVARKAAAAVALRRKDYSAQFPAIRIQNT